MLSGGSGHGFKHGPALGELAAANVLGEKPPELFFLAGPLPKGRFSIARLRRRISGKGIQCLRSSMTPGPESGTLPADVTRLLSAWREGDGQAPGELFRVLYGELHALAHTQLRRRGPQHSLATTGLVHEAYLKLANQSHLDLRDRGHFLSLAARAMRQVVVDHARRRGADKRGGDALSDVLDEAKLAADGPTVDVLALDEALSRLESLEPRLSRIVEMRFFAGFSVEETAEALGLSVRTVKRDWQKARAFLYAELHPEEP